MLIMLSDDNLHSIANTFDYEICACVYGVQYQVRLIIVTCACFDEWAIVLVCTYWPKWDWTITVCMAMCTCNREIKGVVYAGGWGYSYACML